MAHPSLPPITPTTTAPTTPRSRTWARRGRLLAATALFAIGAAAAHAQFAGLTAGPSQPIAKDQPVFYQSDAAAYDRDKGFVTLSGHVEIWQGDRDLRADSVTYDRNTGVVSASGHVVLLDPDGQVVFGDYAELSQGMKDGIIKNMRAQLAQNGRLAANGGRRIDARVNELSRAIYSTCNACKDHPNGPLLWDLRARSAVQDLDNKRIEYSDALLDIYGVPVMYLPYFSHPDPSVRRASGFLVPSTGTGQYLGGYLEVPDFWAIDSATDATIAPMLATTNGPAVNTQFRHAFNDGTMTVNSALAYSQDSAARGIQGDIFAKGTFSIDDEWRWGFDIERATSAIFLRDFLVNGTSALQTADVLNTQIYLEGFGQGSYSRLDARAYQGLTAAGTGIGSNVITAELPYVLPRYQYSYVGEPDALGGRLSVDAGAFNVIRQVGTNTQRISLSTDWERPINGALGDLWKIVLHVDSAGYSTRQLDQLPSFGPANVASAAQAMPTLAVELHWPFQRDAGSWGTQLIEPIAQLIAAPNGSSYGITPNGKSLGTLIPNEDSLDFEFTDATLFNLNRFYGIDRLEGGMRANVALHAAWFFPGGQKLDAQIGQGYRTKPDTAFPVGSGLNDTQTDLVSHVSYQPNSWVDFTSRQRIDHQSYRLNFVDAVASGGPSWLRLSGGYLYTNTSPFAYYDTVPTGVLPTTPRNEVTVGASTSYGHWRLHTSAQRDVQSGQMVAMSVGGAYEDECYIFDVEYNRRYTSFDGDNGATWVLFQVTFKTVGSFGFSAL